MASNPFAIFNNVPSNIEWAKKTQQVLPVSGRIAINDNTPGTVNLGTWEPQNKPAIAPKPAAPVGTLIGKPVSSGRVSAGGGNHAAINPHLYNPDGTPKIRTPKPATPLGTSIGSTAKKPANPFASQPKTSYPGASSGNNSNLMYTPPSSGNNSDARPSPLQQQIQQLQVWQPNLPQQMSFQSGYQQSPYGGQYAPPWMQMQQQPQWGGMSNYYNSMNPWGSMPNPQQMGFNANSAYGQFGNQWQSPFANRQTPNYYGAAQMPVVPNIPTQQPQYVQTPWG